MTSVNQRYPQPLRLLSAMHCLVQQQLETQLSGERQDQVRSESVHHPNPTLQPLTMILILMTHDLPRLGPFLSVVGELHAVIPPILPQTQKTKICDISNNAAYFSFRFQFLSLLFCSSSPCPFSCVLLFTSSFSVPLP